MQTIRSAEFSTIAFQTVKAPHDLANAFPEGFLAVINSARAKHLYVHLQTDTQDICYAHLPSLERGNSITIFSDKRDAKAITISEEELAKVEMKIGEVINYSIEKDTYANTHQASLDLLIDEGSATVKCIVPYASPSIQLTSRKVIVITNLKPDCITDVIAHVICGKNNLGHWEPFMLTDTNVPIGTKVQFNSFC